MRRPNKPNVGLENDVVRKIVLKGWKSTFSPYQFHTLTISEQELVIELNEGQELDSAVREGLAKLKKIQIAAFKLGWEEYQANLKSIDESK